MTSSFFFFFFFFRILNILTHTHGEREKCLKETNSSVYPKEYNTWIHSIDFKHLYLSIYLSILVLITGLSV